MSTRGTWTRSTEPGTETRLALWIRFEGEAMQTTADAADALEKVVAKLRQEEYDGTILDANGNTVGAWDIEAFQSPAPALGEELDAFDAALGQGRR